MATEICNTKRTFLYRNSLSSTEQHSGVSVFVDEKVSFCTGKCVSVEESAFRSGKCVSVQESAFRIANFSGHCVPSQITICIASNIRFKHSMRRYVWLMIRYWMIRFRIFRDMMQETWFGQKPRQVNEWNCNDFKCVRKPTESWLSLTHCTNKSSRWVE